MPDPTGGAFGLAWKVAKDVVKDPHETQDPQAGQDMKAVAQRNAEIIDNLEKKR